MRLNVTLYAALHCLYFFSSLNYRDWTCDPISVFKNGFSGMVSPTVKRLGNKAYNYQPSSSDVMKEWM